MKARDPDTPAMGATPGSGAHPGAGSEGPKEETKTYVGRFVIVNLPYRAGGDGPGARVEDFKLNPELGVLTLTVEPSNYRIYRRRALLSAGAKKALKALTYGATHEIPENPAPYVQEKASKIELFDFYHGGVKVTDIILGVEIREGKMPKIFIPNGDPQPAGYIALITGGSGYRGGYEIYHYGKIVKLLGVRGTGSLGSLFSALYYIEPPAIFHVWRNGRLYGAPPHAIAVFSPDKVVIDQVEEEEISDLCELMGVETHGVEEKGD